MTFIVSSHFITVLGGDDVDLEMPIFLGEGLKKKSVKPFSKAGAQMKKILRKISSKQEI
jgi:hypothetical protein